MISAVDRTGTTARPHGPLADRDVLGHPSDQRPLNAMTVDVEDYFHVSVKEVMAMFAWGRKRTDWAL